MIRTSIRRRNIRVAAAMLTAFFLGLVGFATNAVAQGRELSLADILIALRSKKAVIEEKNKLLADAVKERGITFALTPEIEKELGSTGARPDLISAIRDKNPKPKKDPMAEVAATLAEPKTVAVDPPIKPVLAPPDFGFYRDRATKALKANELDAALIDLDKAAEFKPGEASLFADRGLIHLRREQNEAALEQFSKAVEANPKDFWSYFNRGMVKERLGKTVDALLDYEKAFDLDPTDESAKTAVERLRKVQADAAIAEAARIEADRKAAERAKVPLVISVGALNSYATRLAMPAYPPHERKMRTQGTVTVLISLDTEGKVTSVKAVDGPKQLWAAAEYAAKASKFKPVEREGKPIAASGSISYKFTM